MAKHVLPASILQNLIELALRSRLNLEALFSEAGIDADVIGRPDALIGIDQIDRLFSAAFARTDDPWFGLHAGLANQYSSLDLLGRLMATSSTLGDAIRELLRFKDLLAPYLHFHFEVRGDTAVLACEPDGSVSFAESRHHNDLVVATMVAIGRSLAGGDIGVRALAFRHPEQTDLSEYHRAFGDAQIRFASPRNEVHFAATVLDRRLATSYPQYHQRVEQQAEQQLSRLVRGHSVSEQVSTQIEARLGELPVGIDDIARLFNMTARTLQRRLRDEGVTFGDLRDGVRHKMACRVLAGEDMPMDALAQQLGFSDTANFYHAFRRWEGETPGVWRKRAQGSR
jgi:AraC-like DNA-binding protein